MLSAKYNEQQDLWSTKHMWPVGGVLGRAIAKKNNWQPFGSFNPISKEVIIIKKNNRLNEAPQWSALSIIEDWGTR